MIPPYSSKSNNSDIFFRGKHFTSITVFGDFHISGGDLKVSDPNFITRLLITIMKHYKIKVLSEIKSKLGRSKLVQIFIFEMLQFSLSDVWQFARFLPYLHNKRSTNLCVLHLAFYI